MTENSGYGHAVSILFFLISSTDMREIPVMYMGYGSSLNHSPLTLQPRRIIHKCPLLSLSPPVVSPYFT